jgi:hypothetical protein
VLNFGEQVICRGCSVIVAQEAIALSHLGIR